MQVIDEVRRVLDQILSLNGRSSSFTASTALLGAIPELDSMAVVSLITALEDHFGISVNDDEVDGSVFETVGSLTEFIGAKLDAG